jgi:NAD(P)-dependent dehydrogenase (short-subunit alcohol dehydrogenase family)
MMECKRVVVTGGNTGIGFALCKQLAAEDGCYVYLGSRNVEKGEVAIQAILEAAPECAGRLELVQVDTASDESVAAAAATVKASLGSQLLYGIVNNAGTGLAHGGTAETIVNTNLYGPKRMCEAFLPLLSPSGRIVNVGSGAGPKYVERCDPEKKNRLSSFDVTWPEIEALVAAELATPRVNAYGLSKACLSCYSMILARETPEILTSTISPGFIDTAIVRGFGAKLKPEQGTKAIRHCLFGTLGGNGWYWGSDAVRSPLTHMRNPGEPPFTG